MNLTVLSPPEPKIDQMHFVAINSRVQEWFRYAQSKKGKFVCQIYF